MFLFLIFKFLDIKTFLSKSMVCMMVFNCNFFCCVMVFMVLCHVKCMMQEAALDSLIEGKSIKWNVSSSFLCELVANAKVNRNDFGWFHWENESSKGGQASGVDFICYENQAVVFSFVQPSDCVSKWYKLHNLVSLYKMRLNKNQTQMTSNTLRAKWSMFVMNKWTVQQDDDIKAHWIPLYFQMKYEPVDLIAIANCNATNWFVVCICTNKHQNDSKAKPKRTKKRASKNEKQYGRKKELKLEALKANLNVATSRPVNGEVLIKIVHIRFYAKDIFFCCLFTLYM